MSKYEQVEKLIMDYHASLDYKDFETARAIKEHIEALGGELNVQGNTNKIEQ